jgi:PQQ-like domain
MYGRNLSHTFSNEESLITPSNLSSLQPAWFFQTGDVVTASPTVVDGVVYVGSWDGYFYALDANSGSLKWKFQVDCQNSVVPVPPQCGTPPPPPRLTDGGLITSSAAVKANKVCRCINQPVTFSTVSTRSCHSRRPWRTAGSGRFQRFDCGSANDCSWRDSEMAQCAHRFRLLRYTGPIRHACESSKLTQCGLERINYE